MRHCSVQVRGLLTRDELDRYNGLIEVGSYLDDQNQYDLAYILQKEIDLLILPGIERLKDKSRARDRATAEYLESMQEHDSEVDDDDADDNENDDEVDEENDDNKDEVKDFDAGNEKGNKTL